MILGVDTGGTKTLLALFSNKGEILRQIKYPTPQNYDEYIAKLVESIKDNFADVTAVALALPSPIKDQIPLRFANLPWSNINPKKDLANILKIPVFVENDATLACVSECKNIEGLSLYLAIGTGIGSALAHDGRLISELQASFNVGHIVLNRDNRFQSWEGFAAGRALTRDFGDKMTPAFTEDEWKEVADRISAGILAFAPVIKPLTIVFGGGIGACLPNFEAYLQEILAAHLKPYYLPKIQVAKRPNEATVYGCYDFALQELAGK